MEGINQQPAIIQETQRPALPAREEGTMNFATQLFESEHLIVTAYDPEKDAAIETGFTRNLDYAWAIDMDGIPHPLTAFEIKKKREEALKQSEEKENSFCYAIRTKSDDRFLGALVFPWISWSNRSAGFSLNLGVEADDDLYFEEALHITLRYAFEELDLNHAHTWLGSHDEMRLSRFVKAGMVVEVRQRQNFYRQGHLWDLLSVGISQRDWLRINAGE